LRGVFIDSEKSSEAFHVIDEVVIMLAMDLYAEVLSVLSVFYLDEPRVPLMMCDSTIRSVGDVFKAGRCSGP
tara:strand:+ start:1442 stop:1657 length:216 start_codon:yes stop_codon:yes gene_type:complete